MSKLTGKVAVVTGASKGIGAGIAKHLAAEGASVVVNYASSKEGADKVVAEITGSGGKAVAVHADVSKEEDIERLFAEAEAAFGKVDILVNNAGIFEWLPLEQVTAGHFHRQFDLNVLGLLLTTRKAVAQFGESGGTVINISSVAGIDPAPGGSVYSATKAAVDAITRALALEFGSRKIRINSLNPGMVETEGAIAGGFIGSDVQDAVVARTPLGRVGQPDDIAKAAVFLASDDSGWINGQILRADGGYR